MFRHSVQEEMAGYSNERMCAAIADATKKLEFRSNQVFVIKHFLVGEDVFVGMPTGSGKSLCFILFAA